jgi:hypothetical protein
MSDEMYGLSWIHRGPVPPDYRTLGTKAKRVFLNLAGFLNRLVGCRIKAAWRRLNARHNMELLVMLIAFTGIWALIIVLVLIPAFFALVAAKHQ